jgi:hypothetical protein
VRTAASHTFGWVAHRAMAGDPVPMTAAPLGWRHDGRPDWRLANQTAADGADAVVAWLEHEWLLGL